MIDSMDSASPFNPKERNSAVSAAATVYRKMLAALSVRTRFSQILAVHSVPALKLPGFEFARALSITEKTKKRVLQQYIEVSVISPAAIIVDSVCTILCCNAVACFSCLILGLWMPTPRMERILSRICKGRSLPARRGHRTKSYMLITCM